MLLLMYTYNRYPDKKVTIRFKTDHAKLLQREEELSIINRLKCYVRMALPPTFSYIPGGILVWQITYYNERTQIDIRNI